MRANTGITAAATGVIRPYIPCAEERTIRTEKATEINRGYWMRQLSVVFFEYNCAV
ncbi:hypothetical protein [Virgibacillus salexigens]|uniref:hypothetical protein n=1 Tax=Virgibacillus kapii TaxID=1638645 RepID=UPI00166D7BFB|nr:hypothetical protein [Virgibacillus kapii]